MAEIKVETKTNFLAPRSTIDVHKDLYSGYRLEAQATLVGTVVQNYTFSQDRGPSRSPEAGDHILLKDLDATIGAVGYRYGLLLALHNQHPG